MKIGFLGLLGIAFIVLKLTNVIDWSWWIVTMPLWLPTAAYLLFYLIALFATYLWGLYLKIKYPKQFEEMKKRKRFLKEKKKALKESTFAERLREMQEKQEQLLKDKQQKND